MEHSGWIFIRSNHLIFLFHFYLFFFCIDDDVNDPKPDVCLNSSLRFLIFPSGHHCLYKLANSYCYDGLPVPNLVHYVSFNTTKFYFYNLLSILSSYRMLHPCFIYIHGNKVPEGRWWNHILELVPNIVFVKMDPPRSVFQKPVKVIQHSSDVARLRILLGKKILLRLLICVCRCIVYFKGPSRPFRTALYLTSQIFSSLLDVDCEEVPLQL